MKILRQYWKVLLIAAGVIASAAFYVKEAPEDTDRLLLLAEGEGSSGKEEENDLAILRTEISPETAPTVTEQAGGFSEREKEELKALIREGLEEAAGETVREALREEINAMIEDGRFSEAVMQYVETQSGLVNINTAGPEELKTLSGIGDAKASAILSYREEHGDFASVDELVNVSGISAGLLEKIRDRLTL